MKAPEFWERDGALPRLLSPLGAVYRAAGAARHALIRTRAAEAPVVCVGNIVAGGAGKTPVAISLAIRLGELGIAPQFVSRGYGGAARGPLLVAPGRHGHHEVGDEALLLAEVSPTWVGRDRAAACEAAVSAGAEALVFDDGFQDPRVAKDLSLLVVDSGYGFGNGRLIPAGPLREPMTAALARADAVVLLGENGIATWPRTGVQRPALRARLSPLASAQRLSGRDVLAFAGIGRPSKFFRTLEEIGCRIVDAVGFPDHHRYRPEEVMAICERAARAGAVPVTTRKDLVRLPPEAVPMVETVEVAVEWVDEAALDALLAPIVHDAARRRLRTGAPV